MLNNQRLLYYPIFPDKGSLGYERSDDVRIWVENFLIPAGIATSDEAKANAYLIATGDGDFMRFCRTHQASGKIFLGLNRGTVGFLLNPITDINLIPKSIEELNLFKVKLLKATYYTKSGMTKIHYAFNDVFCGNDVSDFNTFTIRGSLSHFPNRKVSGNGIIIATAQGTTAYTLKVKGSSVLLPLDSNHWAVVGVATGLYPNDTVSPQQIIIDIESRAQVNGYADGKQQTVENINKIVIEPSDKEVTLGFLKSIDFPALRTILAQKEERGENGI